MIKKETILRGGFYLLGMAVLAMGLTLNAKAGLGASAIASVPYTFALGTGLSYADLLLACYCVLVAAQFAIKGKNRSWLDLLQIPVSVVLTRFVALFEAVVPYSGGFLPADLAVLALGIVFTGVGAATTIDMKLVPNPGDGIVSCIAERARLELGLAKNIVDACCVAASLAVGLAFGNIFLGVGLGTIASMIGVGRVISVFNRCAGAPLQRLAGVAQPNGV